MSASSLGTAHLQQTKLSTKAVEMLEPIADWLSDLQFTPAELEFETLNHPQLKAKMTPLLTELGLITKRYFVARIPGPKPAPFYNSAGTAAHIIPIRVEAGYNPEVVNCPLVPGEITCTTSAVTVVVVEVAGICVQVVVVEVAGICVQVVKVEVIEFKGLRIWRLGDICRH
ncbi:hypothetical protein V492_00228 [Pseudogymnoascus sp. VKM F-4246]|nr:hypothetical protein V492_00228 [Pseudogymnoascus sp. VKM F-4246]KFY46988.1 hypothetical protein V494_00240 [Pseudogymnoascus sp. VKM F-4513 (FW-928)]